MYLGVNTPKDLIVEMPTSKLTVIGCFKDAQLDANLWHNLSLNSVLNFKISNSELGNFVKLRSKLRGRPQLTHPPQFGTSGTATHWFTIDTPLIWNVRVCDTVLTIGLLCVKNLLRVLMGMSKLAIPVCR